MTTTDGPGGAGGSGGAGGDGGGVVLPCDTPLDHDDDGDGFTELDGDCDDCDADIHPGAAELATLPGEEPVDENCDEDPEPVACDAGNADVTKAAEAARMIDICEGVSNGNNWGLVDAHYVRANGAPHNNVGLRVGFADKFGNMLAPRVGDALLVLSTGRALDGSDTSPCQANSCENDPAETTPPDGFPTYPQGCAPEGAGNIQDDVGLEVELAPPPNAEGLMFHSAFLTHEYPQWVCTAFDDQFLALMFPKPAALPNANVIFDGSGVPPSASFLPIEHCDGATKSSYAASCGPPSTCPDAPEPYCAAGTGLLEGTGFEPDGTSDGGASTGWMRTVVPLGDGGEVTLRFTIYDGGDPLFDSTVLVDGFAWTGPTDDLPHTGVE